MSNMINRPKESGGLVVDSATFLTYTGIPLVPYPPTDFGTTNTIKTSGGFGTTGNDLVDDPLLAQMGLVFGAPMPPENNIHDKIETDALADTKDWSRMLHAVNDQPVEARRQRYPTQIAGGFPAVEPPV